MGSTPTIPPASADGAARRAAFHHTTRPERKRLRIEIRTSAPQRRSAGENRTTLRGVSMIECLVTIVFVAALMTWFLPATAAVRGGSKQSRCLGNLMRIGYANAVYADQVTPVL